MVEEQQNEVLYVTIQEDIVVARAPGRLDVMGGIADYSGSLVLLVYFPLPQDQFLVSSSLFICNRIFLFILIYFLDANEGGLPCSCPEESS